MQYLEKWQIEQIMTEAKRCNIVDVQSSPLVRGHIETVYQQICPIDDWRNFVAYMHPRVWDYFVCSLRNTWDLDFSYSQNNKSINSVLFEKIKLFTQRWIPTTCVLITEPDNLTIRPLGCEDGKHNFARFEEPQKVWLITNLVV